MAQPEPKYRPADPERFTVIVDDDVCESLTIGSTKDRGLGGEFEQDACLSFVLRVVTIFGFGINVNLGADPLGFFLGRVRLAGAF